MSEIHCRSRTNIDCLIELDRALRSATADIAPMIAECGPLSPDVDWRFLRERLQAALASNPLS